MITWWSLFYQEVWGAVQPRARTTFEAWAFYALSDVPQVQDKAGRFGGEQDLNANPSSVLYYKSTALYSNCKNGVTAVLPLSGQEIVADVTFPVSGGLSYETQKL